MDITSYLLGKKSGGGGGGAGNTIEEANLTLNNYISNLTKIPTRYSTYTTDNVTLYTPNSNFYTYLIVKHAVAGGAKYRIYWIQTNNMFALTGQHSIGQYQMKIDMPELSNFKNWNNQISETSSSPFIYRSTTYSSMAECIQAIQSNSTSYSSTSTGISWYGEDIYTNTTIRDLFNEGELYLPAKKISSNETIEVIS